MATVEYSDKERDDKSQIERDLGLDGVLVEQMRERFLDSELMETGTLTTLIPPVRCSDGKRRMFIDYVDYLFPDPPVETQITQSTREDDVFIAVVQVTDSHIFVRYRRK